MGIRKTVSAMARQLVGYRGKNRVYTIDDVITEFLAHHPEGDVAYLRQAYDFGEKAHEGQTRKSGEPYFTHPTAVAFILAEHKLDIETVCAGFLHDVVEDCKVENRRYRS